MASDYITDSSEIAAFCLADASDIPDAPVIEKGDTVRFIGKRRHWIVTEVNADHAWPHYVLDGVWDTGHGREFSVTGRPAPLDRVELVRKGNIYDEGIADFLTHGRVRSPEERAADPRSA
jgi:hypothetical protein